jgi:hypothetical protein
MTFALRPDGPKEDMPKDRSGIIFGPVNADVTIDVPELQIAAEQVRQEAGGSGSVVAAPELIEVPAYSPVAGYWVTPDAYSSTIVTAEPVNDQGFAVPFDIDYTGTFSHAGLFILDGVGSVYNTRIGIYSNDDGLSGTLLGSTATFNYGDGTVANNTLREVPFTQQIALSPGRYWLVLRRDNGGPSADARFRWRQTNPSQSLYPLATINGPTAGIRAYQGSAWSIQFTQGGTTPVLPGSLVAADFLYLLTVPEIYLKTA